MVDSKQNQRPLFHSVLMLLQMLQLKTTANYISIARSITSVRWINKWKKKRKPEDWPRKNTSFSY